MDFLCFSVTFRHPNLSGLFYFLQQNMEKIFWKIYNENKSQSADTVLLPFFVWLLFIPAKLLQTC